MAVIDNISELAARRVRGEVREVLDSEKIAQYGIKLELINNNYFDLKGEIMGPPNTPYEGGTFELEIKIPTNYPFQAPNFRFVTQVWHVNICPKTGSISLDVLLEDAYTPALSLGMLLYMIHVLLSAPKLNYPQDMAVARQYKKNPEIFKLTASHWTNVYAGGPSKNQSFDDKIKKMMELGFPENQVRVALSSWNWDLENAINQIDKMYKNDDEQSKDD